MTTLMNQALSRLAGLPEAKQNTFASFIISELDSEERWDVKFADSQDMLAEMATQAVEEEISGKTQLLSLRHDFEAH